MNQDSINKVKKRVRKRTIILLVLTLMANSFAWFIYSNKVENSLTTGVRSWKINFKQDGNDLVDYVSFNIDSIYPGMNNYNENIEITNTGEMSADISYEVTSVKIMDDSYTSADYTSNQLISRLQNNYPFKITFTSTNSTILHGQTTQFGVSLVWPYESGNDSSDTYWGKRAYDFQSAHPHDYQIEIHVTLTATQSQ